MGFLGLIICTNRVCAFSLVLDNSLTFWTGLIRYGQNGAISKKLSGWCQLYFKYNK